MPSGRELEEILARMNKYGLEDELDCGACGYDSCRQHAVAIWQGLAEVEMCLPYSVEELHKTVDELQQSNISLETTRRRWSRARSSPAWASSQPASPTR